MNPDLSRRVSYDVIPGRERAHVDELAAAGDDPAQRARVRGAAWASVHALGKE
jgi:hypothetical protein